MLNVYVMGLTGKMGQTLTQEISNSPIFTLERSISDPIDVIIDFSSPDGMVKALSLALETNTPFISGTTGLLEPHFDKLKTAAFQIPILHASNFSFGMNYLVHVLKSSKPLLEDFQVDLFESHHRSKKDSPSGTTLELIKTVFNDSEELNIHTQRTPYFSCSHKVEFSSEHETISLSHSSKSRIPYAKGALHAAKWLTHQTPGLYTMEDVFDSEILTSP